MKLIFISSITPDKESYWNGAFTRSGNNVVTGIVDGIPSNIEMELWSCQPIPSFPEGKLWIGRHREELSNGRVIQFLPILNIKFIKNYFWGFCCFLKTILWRIGHIKEECVMLTYNNDTPPIEFLYWGCRLSGIKLYAILYDLGEPPQSFNIGRLTRFAYSYTNWWAKRIIKRLDGRIVINELIVRDYAPGKDYLLIDGGINQDVIRHLFPLKPSKNDELVFVLAGMLWEQNGTRLVLQMLNEHPDLNVKVVFAGKGIDVPLIQEQASFDPRIEYAGMLNMDELFKLYERADVLLNIRIEDTVDYHFPSKLLEYMSTGKYVISTPVAHAGRDYNEFLSILESVTPEELYNKIFKVISCGKEYLYEKGKKTRQFILENRNWNVQTARILDYLNIKSNK